jgi:hypothetical protein
MNKLVVKKYFLFLIFTSYIIIYIYLLNTNNLYGEYWVKNAECMSSKECVPK